MEGDFCGEFAEHFGWLDLDGGGWGDGFGARERASGECVYVRVKEEGANKCQCQGQWIEYEADLR